MQQGSLTFTLIHALAPTSILTSTHKVWVPASPVIKGQAYWYVLWDTQTLGHSGRLGLSLASAPVGAEVQGCCLGGEPCVCVCGGGAGVLSL